ncbi:hypothetical protein KYB31_23380 [Clostridium felsineum]|uniref:hypothetical protein n=1 Tax=Clostridium felsineum TaxID=36839 RepID=UPI00214DCC37|nr:hypothetical protein [Clostridium felsineum]MCR3761919.1 hypothetical protein [Clostridium felsineum]
MDSNKNSIESKISQASDTIYYGEYEKLIVNILTMKKPNYPILAIDNTNNIVTITDAKIDSPVRQVSENWKGSILLDGYVDNTITYRTASNTSSSTISGNINFLSTRIYFQIKSTVISSSKFSKKSNVEVISAYVENEKRDLLDKNPIPENYPTWAITYNKLSQKILVKIQVKIIDS